MKALHDRAVDPLAEAVRSANPAITLDDATALIDVVAQFATAHIAFPVQPRAVVVYKLERVARMAQRAAVS